MILPYLKIWRTPLLFRSLWPLFKPQFEEGAFSVAILISHHVPRQHNPTCTCSKYDPKPSEIFLFSGFGSGPGSTWIWWMKLHSAGYKVVLSMGFVVIKFILPNLMLIPCFDGLCSSASHYPWVVFDARTEGGRLFFLSLMWNSEHLDIFRTFYTHSTFIRPVQHFQKFDEFQDASRVLVSLFWMSPNGLSRELHAHSLGCLWAVAVTRSLRMEHHQSPRSVSWVWLPTPA